MVFLVLLVRFLTSDYVCGVLIPTVEPVPAKENDGETCEMKEEEGSQLSDKDTAASADAVDPATKSETEDSLGMPHFSILPLTD